MDSEADDLAVALQQVVQLFEQDSKLAEPVKVVSQVLALFAHQLLR